MNVPFAIASLNNQAVTVEGEISNILEGVLEDDYFVSSMF